MPEPFVEAARLAAHPLHGGPTDFDPLLDRIGDASVVLLGEATHGTHEFYRIRGEITKRLVREKGFVGIAVEADWPDAERVNRYIHGRGEDIDAVDALGDFHRFPQWMWRNADVLDLVGWLREHNLTLDRRDHVGFYGLDLYSLYRSIDAVIRYLDRVDPEAAERARQRYACFNRSQADPQQYGYATSIGARPGCEREAVQQLVDLQTHAADHLRRDGQVAEDEQFYAEQNARLVADAEGYYRSMFRSPSESWNLRDRHMAETLAGLVNHLRRRHSRGRLVVWAHNSHLGDARATEMGQRREINLGQLARERFGDDVVIVGFTTYHGSVTAASHWEGPAERKQVRPALTGSIEHLLHEVAIDRQVDAFLLRTDREDVRQTARRPRLQRMIGVIYRPESERQSHYLDCQLADQFDLVLHYDHTRAVEPLERTAHWLRGETPETYPSGF